MNYESWSYGKHYGGTSAHLAKKWGAEKIGFHLEKLSPGKFSCPYHLHQKEEELFIALKGAATLRQDENFYAVNSGDIFFFKTGVAHQLYNHTSDDFLFFALSSTDPNEQCEYPDSRKVLDVKTKTVTQNGEQVEYWKDEEDPSKYWPKENLK